MRKNHYGFRINTSNGEAAARKDKKYPIYHVCPRRKMTKS